MTTQTTNEYAFQVGDHVILTRCYGGAPEFTTVTRTTKTTFQVEGSNRRFSMPDSNYDRKNGVEVKGGGRYAGTNNGRVYAYSQETLVELQTNHEKHETRKAQERAAKDLAKQKQECIRESQMDELKKLISFSDFERKQMPDGSRLYQGIVPTGSQYHGFIFAIIRVANTDDFWRPNKDEKVNAACTYVDQRVGSFSSISSTYHVDDEAAVMEMARYLRNS